MEYLGLNDNGYDIATVGDAKNIQRALMGIREMFIQNNVEEMRSSLDEVVEKVTTIESRLNTLNKQEYTVPVTGNVEVYNDFRRKLFVSGGIGILKLDFIWRSGSRDGRIGTIPADIPTFVGIVEVQTVHGGTVFADGTRRVIEGRGMTNGQRYIVNIMGILV